MYAIAVLEKIKELSLLESNSLTRRQVKTSEELGELSEAVLSVDSILFYITTITRTN